MCSGRSDHGLDVLGRMRNARHGPIIFHADQELPTVGVSESDQRLANVTAYVLDRARLLLAGAAVERGLELAEVALALPDRVRHALCQ